MPPGAGIITSRQTRSGSCSAMARSVESPSAASTTSYPWRSRSLRSSARVAGSSSTARIRGRSRFTAAGPDGVGERREVDRLAEVLVEPGRERPIPIADHGVGGERDDAQPGDGASIRTELAQRLPAVHVGEPEIHEHQVGELLARQCDAVGRGVGRQHLVACRPQKLGRQRPVRRGVLDQQDGRHYSSAFVRRRARRASAAACPAGRACSGTPRPRRARRPGRSPDMHDHAGCRWSTGSDLSSRSRSGPSPSRRRRSIRIAAGCHPPGVARRQPRTLEATTR